MIKRLIRSATDVAVVIVSLFGSMIVLYLLVVWMGASI